MKKAWSTHCLFCDDIRQEAGGKFSLIGIYTDEILINAPHYPIILPSLATYIWVSTPIANAPKAMSGTLLGTAGEELAIIEDIDMHARSDAPNDITKAVIALMTVMSPVQIPHEGFLEAWMQVDGERQRAGRLRVGLQQHPALAPIPISPPAAPPA